MSETVGPSTLDEVSALVGDDVAAWLDNPFLARDLLEQKICWWVSRAMAQAWDERDVARPCDCASYPNPYRVSQTGEPAS